MGILVQLPVSSRCIGKKSPAARPLHTQLSSSTSAYRAFLIFLVIAIGLSWIVLDSGQFHAAVKFAHLLEVAHDTMVAALERWEARRT
jgi:hypothetical protein